MPCAGGRAGVLSHGRRCYSSPCLVTVASLSDAISREARMAQDRTAEVSEAEIAVHWQEEDYIRPPKTFVTQANLKDAAVFDRFSLDKFPECFKEYADLLDWNKSWDVTLDTSHPPFWRWFVGGQLNASYNCVDRHDVSRAAGAWRNLITLFVVDDWVDAGHPWPGAPRFHGVKGRHCAAEESAVLGLPPSVDDNRFALAHHIVVPPPHRGLDWFADCRHMLEVVMILCRLIRASAPQGANCCRRCVKDIDIEFLGDSPWTPGIGVGR